MKTQKIFYAAFVSMTLAVDSALSQFVLTPIPGVPNVASGSVAWGDYDNDGRLDFLLSGSLELSLWRNTGAGFTNVTTSVAPDLPGLYDGAVAWGDFDNDTRLDLLITGLTNFSGRAEVSQVWRNTGSGFTNVPVTGLPGVAQSSAAWSDFDSDGRLDFLLTGTTNGNSSGAISQLWRNTGDGFTNVQIPALTGVYFGSTAWGDFDNDGRPDFLITGITNGSATDATAQLWRNTGSGFTNMPIPGLRGVFVSSLGWGDYDNDGRLDFLLEGLSANGFLSEVWRNTGDGFINVPVPGLPGIADGSLAWGDYDSDGRLDFLITGLANGATRVSQVWRNTGSGFTNVSVPGLPGSFDNSLAWGDYDNDGRLDFLIAGTIEGGNISQLWRNTVIASNSPPAAPAGLSSTVTGSTVVLRWTSPADDHTPTAGLSYNVRMGTTPGGSDIVSAPALTNGGLLVPRTGTARNGSTAIHNLTPGQTYYWSVQAVDTSFTGSPFATEQEFSTSAQDVSIPDPGLNAAIRQALQKPVGPLTEQDLLGLTILDASSRSISSVEGLEVARNLIALDLFQNQLTNFTLPNGFGNLVLLDLGFNSLSQCSIPDGLTNLDALFLEGNLLTSFILPAGLNALTTLDLSGNQLTSFVLPADMTNLITALIFANQLTNLTLPANLSHLGNLDLDFNHLRALELPAGLTGLASFVARDNQLTNLTFPPDMTNLAFIDVGGNQLPNLTLPAGLTRLNFLRLVENELNSLTLPPGLTNLASIFLANNQLTNLTLSSDLFHLVQIDLAENKLARLTLPAGMTNLSVLILDGNQLTTLTLPPDLTKLERLTLSGNPLTTLVLSQPSADTRLAGLVASLANEDVSVFTYPLAIGLLKPRQTLDNTFGFILAGPPGIYAVLGSTDLVAWSALGAVTNTLGSIGFTDVAAHLSSQKFYRVHSVR